MVKKRIETDSFGPLEVPNDKYWGALGKAVVQKMEDK